jgi:hypothetical protein
MFIHPRNSLYTLYKQTLVFILMVFIAACGGGGSSLAPPANGGNNPPAQSLQRGQLLGFSLLSSGSRPITYTVKTYKIVYASSDVNQHIIRASGLLAIPQKAPGEKSPLLSYQHGTTFLNKDAPTLSASTIKGINTLSSTGYIVSAPDYLGYGESAAIMHPYMHADSLASASLDMLRASKTFLKNNNIGINQQLFLSGYSEGGYATIALQKAIQEKHADEFKVSASSAGAGPYDLTGTARILANKVRNQKPSYMSFLIKAYNDIYQLNDISGMYQPPYVNVINNAFDGKHSGGTIDRSLNPLTAELFKPEFLKALQGNGNHALLERLAENNLYDWKPESPTRFFHSPHDETVPYANTTKAVETMRNHGAQNISLSDCFLRTHVSCAPLYVIDTVAYFSRYANDL